MGTAIAIICTANARMRIATAVAGLLGFLTLRKGKPVMPESQKRDAEARAPIDDTPANGRNGICAAQC